MVELSVIVPIYNTPKQYLEHCISSISSNITSIIDEVEVILIDDGSTDLYIKPFLKQVESINSQFRCIFKTNSGVSDTRNVGINEARGKYITFVDSDDYLEENALRHMIDTMKDNYADLIIFGVCRDDTPPQHTKRIVKRLSDKEKRNILLQKGLSVCNQEIHPFLPFGRLFRKSILDNNHIQFETSISLGEDALFNFRYMAFAETICVDNSIVYHYVTNQQSVTQKCSDKMLEQLPMQMDIWEKYVVKYLHNDKEIMRRLCMRCLSEIRTARKQYFSNPSNSKTFGELKFELNKFLSHPTIVKWIRKMRLSDAWDIPSFKNIILLKLHLYWIFLITERKE